MKKVITLILLGQIFISCSYAQVAAQAGQYNFTRFSNQQPKITKEVEALTGKEFKMHPEYGVVPFNAPCRDCFEVLQKRDEKHRYFVKNGTTGHEFYAQSSYNDLSYKDAKGNLLTIDYRLRPTVQNDVYSASNQPFPVTVNLRDKYVSILNAGKEMQVNRNVSLFIKNADGTMASLGEPDWSHYTAGDDGVVIHNIYPGIDMEMRIGEGKVESFYRINKPLNLKGASLVVHDNVQLPQDMAYDFSYAEKKNDNLYEGALCINNANGMRYYIIGSPAAFDENGGAKDFEIGLQYGINKNNSYDLYVPISWMNDPGRSYPILIDPYVTAVSTLPQASITGSGYNATCFSGGCQYDLNVNVPAATTVTDIRYSFSYSAIGTCNLNQGAFDLTYKTCRNPASTSSWHTCTIGLPGNCLTDTISCFNDVKTCIPAPQCASYSMPFVLTFYRCVQSASGCGFSCINAFTPWNMTVNGYTANVSLVNNSGDTTICQGSNVSLTAAADSGVAPYTYTWYPGGLSGATVSVSPSSTTTYTLTASMCGGADSVQTFAKVTVAPNSAVAGPDTTVCSGSPVQLQVSAATSYSWSPTTGLSNPNIANPVATDTATTTYTVSTTTGACHSTATVTITVLPFVGNSAPSISADPDTNAYSITAGDSVTFNVNVTGVLGQTVYLTGTSALLNGGYNASLSPSDTSGITSLTRTFRYISSCNDAAGSPFYLKFTGSNGKSSCGPSTDTTYTVTITVVSPSAHLLDTIPNIFTPNGDGLNDSLSLYRTAIYPTDCWTNFHIQIFNRWGEPQFESTDIHFHWDGNNKSGTKVSQGVYYYIITADFLGKAVTKKGTVNVTM